MQVVDLVVPKDELMIRRCGLLLASGGGKSGGNVASEHLFSVKGNVNTKIGSGALFEINSSVNEDRLALSAIGKAAALMREQKRRESDEFAYEPTLKREWVNAPPSVLSTRETRSNWFRLMSFNMMTDSFSAWPSKDGSLRRTHPVSEIDVKIPSFARPGAEEAFEKASTEADKDDATESQQSVKRRAIDSFVSYDSAIDKDIPPFIQFPFRRSYLVNEIRYYDPDIICLNEVNRPHFNDGLWKYVRTHGYGALYSSSRGFKVKAMRGSDLPRVVKHLGKIEEAEDIGNVIFFHKGRFVPMLMPGAELPDHLHFAQFASLKDKLTNMTVLCIVVSLTAGDTPEAAAIRAHEARLIINIAKAITAQDIDRSHTTVVVCGDLNCAHDEEECVTVLREIFFSAYDVVGGPRWTTWHHRKADPTLTNPYYEKNRQGWIESDTSQTRMKQHMDAIQRRAADRKMLNLEAQELQRREFTEKGTVKKFVRHVEKRFADESFPWLSSARTEESSEGIAASSAVEEKVTAEAEGSDSTARTDTEKKGEDAALVDDSRELAVQQGVIKRTQDFIFYDANTLALHRVLDSPEDSEIDEVQCLPCPKHPSHHIPLIVDVSFNNMFPDVGEVCTKPN